MYGYSRNDVYVKLFYTIEVHVYDTNNTNKVCLLCVLNCSKQLDKNYLLGKKIHDTVKSTD